LCLFLLKQYYFRLTYVIEPEFFCDGLCRTKGIGINSRAVYTVSIVTKGNRRPLFTRNAPEVGVRVISPCSYAEKIHLKGYTQFCRCLAYFSAFPFIHTPVTCKMLCGYTEAELRAVNIKDNTHQGEWDLDVLSAWTADLNMAFGIDADKKEVDERTIPDMEPIRFEKYDYVIIACDNEIDYNELVRNLGIEGAKIRVAKRKLKARAVWYHDIKAQIIPKAPVEETEDAE